MHSHILENFIHFFLMVLSEFYAFERAIFNLENLLVNILDYYTFPTPNLYF